MLKNQLTFTSTALTLALASTLLSTSQQADAHGYMYSPMARQSFCELQQGYWWPKDGSNIPNAACRAAYLDSGYFQFVQQQEFAVNTSDFTNLEAVKANIADGTLCAGGDKKKKGMDLPSSHWQRTDIVPNANGDVKIRFLATTPHNPSFWQFYLSDASYDGTTMPLTWKDIKLVQSHGNIDFMKDDDGNRFYEMNVNIPADRVGDAILYSRWQRDDVVGEGFYNCSDVTIVRDNLSVDTWFNSGFYIKQGQTTSVGERVSLRVFDENGQEVVNEKLLITQANQDSWARDLAQTLNRDYAHLVNIGIKDSQGDIAFDNNNLFGNVAYLSDENYTFALSVQAAPVNTAPTVHAIENLVMESSSTKSVHVHAFDDEQSTLTFTWHVPNGMKYAGAGANIVLGAPLVEKDTDFTLSVDVADGMLITSQTFTVTIKKRVVDTNTPSWNSTTTYSTGDKVSYQNKVYSAKWWNKNQLPSASGAWKIESLTQDGPAQWHAQNAYSQGVVVNYQNISYQAKWWTKGDQPDVSNVWTLINSPKN